MLRGQGAQFAVLLDEAVVEVRHWNSDGIIEDIATGSAAGTIGAYRLKYGLVRGGEEFVIQIAKFVGIGAIDLAAAEIAVQLSDHGLRRL